MKLSLRHPHRSLWHYFHICCLTMLCVLGSAIAAAAQQPTATIADVGGEVLVSFGDGTSAPGAVGIDLYQGDAIQTKAGAFVLLELSDGSRLELAEDTNLLMEQLAVEPYSEARVSRVKLWWGKMRAVLSPGHQKEGASFDVQTPNSLVGVKFSKPDLEVEFDRDENSTRVFAYTVDVVVLNLISGATQVVAAGTGAAVIGNGIQLLPQLPQAASGAGAASAPPPPQAPPPVSSAGGGGILSGNTGTIAVAGLGAAAVAGGVIALSGLEEETSEAVDFSGTFQLQDSLEPGVDRTVVLQLSQNDRDISGSRTETVVVSGCCTAVGTGDVSGTVSGNSAVLTIRRGAASCRCAGTGVIGVEWAEEIGRSTATLSADGGALTVNGQSYARQ